MASKIVLIRKLRTIRSVFLASATAMALFFSSQGIAQDQTPSSVAGQSGSSAPASPLAPPAQGTQVPGSAGTPSSSTTPTPTSRGGISGIGGGSGNMQFFELRAFSNLTRVTGEARDRSFLTPGNNNDFDFSYLQDFTHGAQHFEVVSVGRYTDDVRVDPEHTSL